MQSTRITIPIHCIRHGLIGGVESSIYNLVKGLYLAGSKLTLAFSNSDNLSPEFAKWLGAREDVAVSTSTSIRGPVMTRFIEETIYENMRRSSDDIILYPNYFLPYRLSGGGPRCAIIYDSQFKIYPSNFSAAKRAFLQICYRRALDRADAVFVISNHELEMIETYFGAGYAQKCRVLFNAIDWDRYSPDDSAAEPDLDASRRYILSVSHSFPHKNVETLIRAFDRIAQVEEDVLLYLVGRLSENSRACIQTEISASARRRIRSFGFISDKKLGRLYRHATVFAFPSLYEGFGMPLAEALGFGVPVIATDCSAVPEVTGGFATLLPRQASPADWASAILAKLTETDVDPTLRARASAYVRERYSCVSVASRALNAMAEL